MSNQAVLRWLSKRTEIGSGSKTDAIPEPGDPPRTVGGTLRSPGQPLDASARAYFEPRFGRDLSRVRIHTGERAAESARGVQAAAYTVGQDIVFGAGRYRPQTGEGRRLLAHEIVHTLQQENAAAPAGRPLEISKPSDTAEQEAARVAANFASGAGRSIPGPSQAPVGISRVPLRVQRDIVGTQDLPTGRFAVNFAKHDAALAAVDAGANVEAARAGERGTITFTPDASAPQSNQIRFLQVARLTKTASGALNEFGGAQAPLNEMRSQPGEYAEGGFFVDVQPDPDSRRTRKSDLPVEPFYDSSDKLGRSRVTAGNRMGWNSGGSIAPAVLEDNPRSRNALKYELISTAKAADTGAWYGSVFWGFEIFMDNGIARIRNESVKFSQWEGRDTSQAALRAFNEYYRNPGASTEPKIP